MTDDSHQPEVTSSELSAWERADIFPEPPLPSPYGYISPKGDVESVESQEQLIDAVLGKGKYHVALVWADESDRCVPPEEVTWLGEAVLKRDRKWAKEELKGIRSNAIMFSVIMAWALISKYINKKGDIPAMFADGLLGVVFLFLTMFAILPFYEAWKSHRRLMKMRAAEIAQLGPESRFDHWVALQKAPVTKAIWIGLAIVAAVQLLAAFSSDLNATVQVAGLVKGKVSEGEWWRLLTAPFMHGHPLHWMFNASALWFLGKRVEILARWVHVPMILAVSGLVGGLSSWAAVSIYPQPSVGASGAIVGLLGFLIVFEWTHPRLCPRSVRRRMLAAVFGLAVIGVVGIQLIDNAAHLGGLLAGAAYAWFVFPKSRSPHRPEATEGDKWVAYATGGILLGACLLSLVKLLALLD